MTQRERIAGARRLVVKIGSALLTNDGRGLASEQLTHWVDQMMAIQKQGTEIVLVSSGAVAEGMTRLGWQQRPHLIHELQAAAAVGQMGLVQAWEVQFQRHGTHTALVLLTHDDLSDRKRYLNARSTLRTLLQFGVVPIVNENDTVVTDEIRFGDNDTLGALVANLVEADGLVLLTDQDALYETDPRTDPDAKPVDEAMASDEALDAMVSDGGRGRLGRGGMLTKLRAARLAARSGAFTLIAGGRTSDVLLKARAGERTGTLLLPDQERLAARKQWLAGHLNTRGRLVLDDGAVDGVCRRGKSLLPVGVRQVEGQFQRGEMVSCVDGSGREVARGLVSYDADEARRIIGYPSERIADQLGYVAEEELIHRDNMVLV